MARSTILLKKAQFEWKSGSNCQRHSLLSQDTLVESWIIVWWKYQQNSWWLWFHSYFSRSCLICVSQQVLQVVSTCCCSNDHKKSIPLQCERQEIWLCYWVRCNGNLDAQWTLSPPWWSLHQAGWGSLPTCSSWLWQIWPRRRSRQSRSHHASHVWCRVVLLLRHCHRSKFHFPSPLPQSHFRSGIMATFKKPLDKVRNIIRIADHQLPCTVKNPERTYNCSSRKILFMDDIRPMDCPLPQINEDLVQNVVVQPQQHIQGPDIQYFTQYGGGTRDAQVLIRLQVEDDQDFTWCIQDLLKQFFHDLLVESPNKKSGSEGHGPTSSRLFIQWKQQNISTNHLLCHSMLLNSSSVLQSSGIFIST